MSNPYVIDRFTGEYRFLSNFYTSVIEHAGMVFPTVEHAYQACKAEPGNVTVMRMIAAADTPGHAKRLGRMIALRPDWEAIKLSVMRHMLGLKFTPGSIYGDKLLATGDNLLVEGNTWGDDFWGEVIGPDGGMRGLNWLGHLLMARRAELRAVAAAGTIPAGALALLLP